MEVVKSHGEIPPQVVPRLKILNHTTSWNRSFYHSSFKSLAIVTSVRRKERPDQSGFRRSMFRNQFTSLCPSLLTASRVSNALELAVCRWNTATHCPLVEKGDARILPLSSFRLSFPGVNAAYINRVPRGPVAKVSLCRNVTAITSISIIELRRDACSVLFGFLFSWNAHGFLVSYYWREAARIGRRNTIMYLEREREGEREEEKKERQGWARIHCEGKEREKGSVISRIIRAGTVESFG